MRLFVAITVMLLAPFEARALTIDGAPDFVMRRVNGLIKGSVRSGSISYSAEGGLVLRQAELHHPSGRLVLAAKRIQVRVGLLALLRDVINIESVHISGLQVNMNQTRSGEIDLLEALALREPTKDDEPSDGGVRIKSIQVQNSAINMTLGDIKIAATGMNLSGDLEAVGQFAANLRLRTGDTRFTKGGGKGPATVDVRAAGLALDHIGLGTHSISLTGGRMRIDKSHRLAFSGMVRPGASRITFRAAGALPDGWLQRILPASGSGIPPIQTLSIATKLSGAMSSPTIDIDAQAARIDLPGAAPRLDGVKMTGSLRGSDLSIHSLTAETLGGDASLSGKLFLGGDLHLDGELRLNACKLARLAERLKSLGGSFTGRALLKGPLALTDAKPLSIGLRGRLTGIDLPSLGKQNPDLDLMILQGDSTRLMPSQATIGANTITVDGSVYPEVTLNWRARLKRARKLLAAIGTDFIPPAISARGQIRLEPRLAITFRGNTSPFTLAGQKLGAIALRGSLNDEGLKLDNLRGTVNGAELNANLRLPFARIMQPVGRLELKKYPIPGGAGFAELDLASDPEGNWEGTVLASELKAAGMELGTLELLARYNGERLELRAMDWDEGLGILSGAIGINTKTMRTDGGLDLYLDRTGLELLAGDTIKGRVQVHIEPKGLITEPAARVLVRFDELAVAGIPIRRGVIALAGTPEAVGGTISTSGNGTGRATIRLSDGFERMNLSLKLTAFRLDSLPIDLPELEALADIDLRLSGPIGKPVGEAQIRLRDLAVDDRLVGNGRGRISVSLGEAMNAELDLLGWITGTVEGNYPAMNRLTSRLELDARGLQWMIPGLAGGGTEIDTKASIIAGLRDGEPDALVTVHALRIGNPGLWEEELENEGKIILGYGGGRARIEQLNLRMGAGKAELRGWVEPEGEHPRASIALSSSLPVELLQLVDPGFALTRGRFGINASLLGRWGAGARLQATFEPEPGTTLLHAAYPRQVTFTGGSIRLEDQGVTVNDLHLEMGAGELNLAGQINLEEFNPTELDLRLTASNLLLRHENQWVELSSDLVAAGPIDSAKISGSLNLASGRIEQTFDITNFVFSTHTQGAGPSLEEQLGLFAATELDLEVTSAAGVQIIAGLPLFSVQIRPTIDLRIVGQLADLGILGVVEVEEGNGEILFPEAAFAIDNATVDLSQDPYYVSVNSIWEYVPRRSNDGEQDDVIPLRLGIEGPINRLELRLNAPDYPDLTRPQLLGMLAQGQTPDLLIGQSLGEEGDSSYGDVALRMLTGQMFKRFERELERVFKIAFELPLDAAIDLGVDTLRMQGVVNITERFLVSGEAEVVFGTEDSSSVDDNQNATATSNNRQSLSSTFVLTDAWRAEADLRSGYRSDDNGSLLELLLNLHWRLWYQ